MHRCRSCKHWKAFVAYCTPHFGHPAVQGENDSEGSEYSDSEDQIMPDSDDEGTLEAAAEMQILDSVFLPPHLQSKVMLDKIVRSNVPDEAQ